MNIISQFTKPGLRYIDFKSFLKRYHNKNFTFLDTTIKYNTNINKDEPTPFELLLKRYTHNNEPLFIHIGRDKTHAPYCDRIIINKMFDYDIDLDRVWVITSNKNYAKDTVLKSIYFNFYETAIKNCKDMINIDVTKKNHSKKFLCLNHAPSLHRKQIVYNLVENSLLNECNVSYNDEKLKLSYDDKFTDTINSLPNEEWRSSIAKTSTINYSLIFNENFSYDNSIFIITESLFSNEGGVDFITEKTYKAILLKMPFIIVGQPNTLKILRELGYRTFDHMWDESYDNILDSTDRIQKINNLILNLSKQDVKQLVIDNYDILEYNYQNLINSNSEIELFNTLEMI